MTAVFQIAKLSYQLLKAVQIKLTVLIGNGRGSDLYDNAACLGQPLTLPAHGNSTAGFFSFGFLRKSSAL